MRMCHKNKKVNGIFFMNAAEGVKKWTSEKHTMGSIDGITDDDKIVVIAMKPSPKK